MQRLNRQITLVAAWLVCVVTSSFAQTDDLPVHSIESTAPVKVAQRIDPITEAIPLQERTTTRIPVDNLPPVLQALGSRLFDRSVFDGEWYSADAHIGLRINGKHGTATVTLSDRFKAGDSALFVMDAHGAGQVGRDIVLPFFNGMMRHPDGAQFRVQGRLTPSGKLVVIAMSGFLTGSFVWLMDRTDPSAEKAGRPCEKRANFDGYWYSPELKYLFAICGTEGRIALPPTGPWVNRPLSALSIAATSGGMFQGRLVQQNSKPLEVIGLLTSDRKLRIQTKAPARVVSTLIPITGQHEKRPIGKVAILVDGMEADATFDPVSEVVSKSPNATRVSAYLIKESSLTGVLSRVGTDYETVLWNGDIFDKVAVRNAIDQLKCRILDLADVKVDLVTHSYGTIIAYAALQELAEAIPRNCSIPNAGKYEIDNFVTFASPLGRDEFIVSWFGAFPAITIPKLNDILEPRSLKIQGRWLNFYHSTDCIGGKIDRPFIEDFSYNQDLVVLGPDCGPAHTYSFQDANPLRKLWEELRKSEGTP